MDSESNGYRKQRAPKIIKAEINEHRDQRSPKAMDTESDGHESNGHRKH